MYCKICALQLTKSELATGLCYPCLQKYGSISDIEVEKLRAELAPKEELLREENLKKRDWKREIEKSIIEKYSIIEFIKAAKSSTNATTIREKLLPFIGYQILINYDSPEKHKRANLISVGYDFFSIQPTADSSSISEWWDRVKNPNLSYLTLSF